MTKPKPKRFKVLINLENESFDSDPRQEIRRILEDLVDRLHIPNPDDEYYLQDSNGNTVGIAGFRGRR